MLFLAANIWIIGWSFSVGLCFKDTKGLEGTIASILYLMFWPLLLGCWVREAILGKGE